MNGIKMFRTDTLSDPRRAILLIVLEHPVRVERKWLADGEVTSILNDIWRFWALNHGDIKIVSKGVREEVQKGDLIGVFKSCGDVLSPSVAFLSFVQTDIHRNVTSELAAMSAIIRHNQDNKIDPINHNSFNIPTAPTPVHIPVINLFPNLTLRAAFCPWDPSLTQSIHAEYISTINASLSGLFCPCTPYEYGSTTGVIHPSSVICVYPPNNEE